jgi:hypothetical protein
MLNILEKDNIWVIYNMPYTLNGENIISGHSSGTIILWDLKKLTRVRTLKEHYGKVFDLKALYSGKDTNINNYQKLFISAGEDKLIKIWNIELNYSLKTYVNNSTVFCLENLFNYSLDESLFLSGDKNKTISLWKVDFNNDESKNLKLLTIETDHETYVWRLLHLNKIEPFSYVLSGGNPEIKLYDLDDESGCEEAIRTYKGHSGWVHSLIYVRDNLFASGSSDKSIKIWNFNEEACVKTLFTGKGIIYSLLSLNEFVEVPHEDLNIIISSGDEKKIKFIDFDTQEVLEQYSKSEGIYKMVFLPNSERFKICGIDYGTSRSIYLWGKK